MKQRDTRKERKVRETKETATKEEKSVRERDKYVGGYVCGNG